MEPDQLAKLVRSYPEGTNVTLTILRKNAEQKVTVKLGKHEVRQRDHDFGFNLNMDGFNEKMQAFNEKMNDFKFDSNFGPDIRETVRNAQRESARSVREAQREATRATREAQREAQRNAREMRVFSRDKGAMKSTTIDLGKATIVFSDEKGEMKLETVDGKKILTAKDPEGKLLFSGPVDNQQDVDKLPANVRERYDKLEHKDLPTVVPNTFVENNDEMDNDNDNNNDNDNDEDNNNDNDNPSANVSGETIQQISCPRHPRFVRNVNLLSV